MRWLSFCLVLVACDSPGSSGPCVDCAPPADSVDGAVDANNEVVDTTPETELVLPEVGDDATPIECVDGLTRCVGELVETCISGHFIATQQCESNQVCMNGACRANDCTPGVTECRDGLVRHCDAGSWEEVETCQYGCDGQGCATRGVDECAEVWRCLEQAGCYREGSFDQACVDECKREGTEETAFEVQAITSCFDECGGDGPCLIDGCVPKLTPCRFPRSGNGTCDALAECADACFNNESCITNCYNAASRDAQTRYMQFVNCAQLVCNGFPGCPECSPYESDCLFESR